MSIRVDDLSYLYQRGSATEKAALRNVTLHIEAGQCTGIAGRTGSGKTTLLQHLNGLLTPTGGSISLDGHEVTARNRAELRKRVGLVFQHPEQQFFEATVQREIAFGLSRSGLGSAEIEMRVREALQAVGLGEELLGASPFRLSGGQQRRVAIAGVLVMRPPILALDEPAAGLDPQGRRGILALLARLRRERGMTLVLVSHSMEELAPLADRLVILKNGSVAMEGRTRDLFRDVPALEKAGVGVPQIRRFMLRLKQVLPDIDDCMLTVEEARDEIKRVLGQGKGRHAEGVRPGRLLSGDVDYAPVGPENEDRADALFHGGGLSC